MAVGPEWSPNSATYKVGQYHNGGAISRPIDKMNSSKHQSGGLPARLRDQDVPQEIKYCPY